MKNLKKCTVCEKPLSEKGIKKGRTEHFKCRAFKRVSKKLTQGFDFNSQHFEDAVRAVDENQELLMKKL